MLGYLEKNKKFALAFLILIGIEIFLISSIPGQDVRTKAFDPSVFYHLIVYFLFNSFLMISLSVKDKISKNHIFFGVFFSLIYAALDEIHQVFIPLRSATIYDFLIDSLGIFLSTIVYLSYKRSTRNNRVMSKKKFKS